MDINPKSYHLTAFELINQLPYIKHLQDSSESNIRFMKISMLDEAKLSPTLKSSWHNKSNVGRNCCPISVLLYRN